MSDNLIELANMIGRIRSPTARHAITAISEDYRDSVKAQQQAASITNVLLVQEETISTLQKRLDRYQAILDQNVPNVLTGIKNSITGTQSAYAALQHYGSEWFATLPYSDIKVQQIAQSLIDLTKPYVGKTNQFWNSIVAGDFSALEADDTEEPQRVAKRLVNVNH